MNNIKVGIIGVGNMGSSHLKNITNGNVTGMTVTAVCDTNPEKTSSAKEKYPELEVFDDYRELLKKADIDAVIIATPHPLHAKIATASLESGKHTLLEKPEDIAASVAEKLNSAAEKSEKIFAIDFNQRTNGLFQEAHRLVKSGELGELKRSVWIITNWYRTEHYYASGSWRATWRGEGGGVLLNQAPHNLDLWQWICGMPKSVTAFCNVGKFHNIEVEDEATIYTEYENGATGVFIITTGDCPGTNRFEITGTRGKIVLENGILKLWHLKTDEREICKTATQGSASPEIEYSEFTCEKESGHAGILQNFANAILKSEELIAKGTDGIKELTISNAAYLSEWSGNKKITLPLNTEEFDKILKEKIEASVLKEETTQQPKDKTCGKRWQVNW